MGQQSQMSLGLLIKSTSPDSNMQFVVCTDPTNRVGGHKPKRIPCLWMRPALQTTNKANTPQHMKTKILQPGRHNQQ